MKPRRPRHPPGAQAVSPPAAKPAKSGPRAVCTEVKDLSEDLQKLVRQMLIEGATFEDIVEAINERGQEKITLHAVQNYFRPDLSLQQQRVKHQLEAAQSLKQAMGDPESGQQELADAILMTGLMRVNRRGSDFTAHDAVYEKFKRDNLRLKKDQVRMQWQKLRLDKRLAETRLKAEQGKQELVKARLREMQQLMESRKGGKSLGPEAFEKIQEIYGLVSKPSVPKGAENAAAGA